MSKVKPIKSNEPIQFDDTDFPKEATAEERKKALALIGIDPDTNRPFEEKVALPYNNDAMLGDSGNKKITTTDRVRALFKQRNFSAITKLLRLVEIEEAKMEAHNRAINMGLEPRLLDCLPQPDKKFYATLLLQLVKFEIPEYKSIEVSGQIEAGMTVNVIHSSPQQKVVRLDAGAPEHLKRMFGQTTQRVLEVATAAVKVVSEEDEI